MARRRRERVLVLLVGAIVAGSGIAALATGAAAVAAGSAGLQGQWAGRVTHGPESLLITLCVEEKKSFFAGSMDVPALARLDQRAGKVSLKEDAVRFAGLGTFNGTLADGRMTGQWKDGKLDGSFELAPVAGSGCRDTDTEDVSFESGDVTLAGTLHRPDGGGPHPAVVLIHGSGPEDRGSLRSYASLFARNGVAALAYDKRGVGKSTGDSETWRRFSFDDLAADATAGVRFLASRDDIEVGKIGLFGVSQGGWVAPLAASRAGNVAFLVIGSGSVSTVARDRLFERAARLKTEGFTDDEIAQVTRMQEIDQELTRSGEGFDDFNALWTQHEDARWFRRVYLGERPVAADHEWRLWYRTVLDFDPVPILASLDIPALFLFGDPEHDRFGPVAESVANVERLAREKNKNFTTHVCQDCDHSLMLTDARADVWPWDEVQDGESLETLVSWVSAQVQSR